MNGSAAVNCEPLINAKEAAELLGIHERTLRGRASAREIPGFRIGTRWKFRASDLDEWIRIQLSSSNHPRQRMEV
jgi:excisionase family DNA binding protein